jgi:iron complex outermembrane recepter protein
VAALPDQGIASYGRLDARIAWHREDSLEISLVGQNLLTPRHEEFGDDAPLHTVVPRNLGGKIVWYFKK